MLDEILAFMERMQGDIKFLYNSCTAIVQRIDADAVTLNKWFAEVKDAFAGRDAHLKACLDARDKQILEAYKQINQRLERLEMLTSDKLVQDIENPKKFKQVGNS